MDLIVHIGLPKTATTFLQYGLFKHIKDIVYIHRSNLAKNSQATRLHQSVVRVLRDCSLDRVTKEAHDVVEHMLLLLDMQKLQHVLISDENLCMRQRDFWLLKGKSPRHVAKRIGLLKPLLAESGIRLKVMVGIRQQAFWLASRYAESSKSIEDFSQDDFDRRMCDIADPAYKLIKAQLWIDYYYVYSQIREFIDASEIIMIPTESLKHHLRQSLQAICEFMGISKESKGYIESAIQDAETQIRNKLSTSTHTWAMRNGSILHLTSSAETEIRKKFDESNQLMRNHILV